MNFESFLLSSLKSFNLRYFDFVEVKKVDFFTDELFSLVIFDKDKEIVLFQIQGDNVNISLFERLEIGDFSFEKDKEKINEILFFLLCCRVVFKVKRLLFFESKLLTSFNKTDQVVFSIKCSGYWGFKAKNLVYDALL